MSHFTVLVIGDDVEQQLAPFHEFECTGIDDEYVQEIDQTDESRSEYEGRGDDYKGKTFAQYLESYYGRKTVPFGSCPSLEGPHKYGYTLLDENGDVLKTVDRTNPNKQWDWYQIGGRWTGFFKVKPSRVGALGTASLLAKMDADYRAPGSDRADQCLKADIDIEGMREDAARKAASQYDLFSKTIEGLPPLIAWTVIREKHGDENIDEARKEYHAQPAVKALHENKDTLWFDAADFACTREEYIEWARKSALITFAVLKNGKWHERGSMGWWGIVSDEKNEDEWTNQFFALINDLPDNTLLTIVDCHI
jgi:hypothetical protein